MYITAIPIKSQDLQPGDLFSTSGNDYWKNIGTKDSIGERVFIRTNSSTPQDQFDIDVFMIVIEDESEDSAI